MTLHPWWCCPIALDMIIIFSLARDISVPELAGTVECAL